jgi:hypothetical protein
MKLITVCNHIYYESAKKLIESFRVFYPNHAVTVYYFGGDRPNINANEYIEIPKTICEHAHNPNFFFYKTYALYDALMHTGTSILYLDSRHRLLAHPIEIEQALKEKTRFLVQYPNTHIMVNGNPIQLNNESQTTQKCFESMECDEQRFKKSSHYWAAIQAWLPTSENLQFVNEFLNHMKNPNIAGPSNLLWKPEPENPACYCHRNDQSVLSILIEKYGWHQEYNDFIWKKYGDFHTIKTAEPEPVIIGRQILL